MRHRSAAWHDHQYDNRARIPEHPSILRAWAEASARARAASPGWQECRYGGDPSERLDVFPPRAVVGAASTATGATAANGGTPAAAAAPVLVWLHGGYWRALGKGDQSFVAPPFTAAGALVVVPGYALCPAVSVEHIVLQTVRALAWVHRHAAAHGGDAARIVVAGHSAGGQLAAMLLACDWRAVAPDLPADLVKAALAVSGVFEMEPLRHAPFLAPDLQLDAASARRLSPALLPAPARGRLVTVVGGAESEEFLRQSRAIAAAWPRVVVAAEIVRGRHHLDVIDELVMPGSRTQERLLQLLGLGAGPAGG